MRRDGKTGPLRHRLAGRGVAQCEDKIQICRALLRELPEVPRSYLGNRKIIVRQQVKHMLINPIRRLHPSTKRGEALRANLIEYGFRHDAAR